MLFRSRLIQHFLRFPCAYSQYDVGARCPVLYRLRYNPKLSDDTIVVKEPFGIQRPEYLAEHLRDTMKIKLGPSLIIASEIAKLRERVKSFSS